jgi:type IV secretory pathway TrbF-like protein
MQSKIESQVMASVGTIYAARRIVSGTALKAYALVASVYALGALVWVSRIGENLAQAMNGGVLAVGNFVLYAVMHTTFVVQAVLLVATIALVSLAVDAVRAVSPRSAAY